MSKAEDHEEFFQLSLGSFENKEHDYEVLLATRRNRSLTGPELTLLLRLKYELAIRKIKNSDAELKNK